MKLKDKVAVITGGTGGLGWRICRSLGNAGMKIVLVYLNSHNKAHSYAEELKREDIPVITVPADITTEEGIESVINTTHSEFGSINVLILNAAYNKAVPFQDLDSLSPELWNYILDYNLTSPFLFIRKVGEEMKNTGEGRIVTISSVAGLNPSGSSIAYCAAKAGLIHLSRCMAVALAPEVLVNSIAPGLMEGTRMTENLTPEYAQATLNSTLLKRAADKDDVANAVLTFVGSDSITGQTLVVDSGKIFH